MAAFLRVIPDDDRRGSGDSGCCVIGEENKKGEVALWRPGGDYFPDVYDKRSGLCSSILVGIERDREVREVGPTFSPVMSKCSSWGSGVEG